MIIAISHQKGGVGKSTIAWNVAIRLQEKYNVELVDLDIQKTITYTNEIRKNQTDHTPLNIIHLNSAEELKAYIEKDQRNKISIIDIGGFDSSFNRVAIITADLLITPVSDRSFELLGLKSFEKVLHDLSILISENVEVNILLNNINPQKSKLDDLKEFINKSKHFTLLESILRTRADYDKSAGIGKSVMEFNSESKASIEIKNLCEEIEKILNIH